MKTLKILTLALTVFLLWSCEKSEVKSVIKTEGLTSSLNASVTTVVIDKNQLTTDVIRFTLTQPDYGYKAGVTNVLQLSTKADNFATGKYREYPVDANTTTKAYKGGDFNTMLLALNLSTTANTDILVRLKSTVSAEIAPVYSSAVTLSAKPFPLTAWLYVPGAYQGWNPSTADSLVSPAGNGIYSGIINFTEANQEFKVTPKKTWDLSYGDAGDGKISTSGGNLKSATAGAKLVTVNLNDMTYTIEDNKVWSIIGDATSGGWDTDTDMKTTNDGKNIWKLTTTLAGGNKELKFRFGHNWGTNLGGNLSALTEGGDNIKIADAGTYNITLTVSYNAEGKISSAVAQIVKN